MVKNPLANAGAAGEVGRPLGWEDPLEEEMPTQVQYSGLESSMDSRAWGSQKIWT